MDVRSATAADVDDICALWAAAGLGGGAEVDQAEALERLREPDGFFVVGEEDGVIVAVAMGCYDNHRGWLKRVAMHPDHRGRGLGRQIVTSVEQRFQDAGVRHLRLAVFDGNDAGLSFWNEMAYEELPTIRYFTKDLRERP